MTKSITLKSASGWAAAALALALLQGCATGPAANPADPLEPFNRTVFNFNDGLDRAVLKPVATAYQNVTPQPIRTGVTNFFENISDAWSFVNNVLQARPVEAADSFFTKAANSFSNCSWYFVCPLIIRAPIGAAAPYFAAASVSACRTSG